MTFVVVKHRRIIPGVVSFILVFTADRRSLDFARRIERPYVLKRRGYINVAICQHMQFRDHLTNRLVILRG